jgi:hypothetical protein
MKYLLIIGGAYCLITIINMMVNIFNADKGVEDESM